MYLVAIAWLYVALMMALAEAMHPAGGVLGAVVTFVMYGAAPVTLVMYLLGTPMRKRARKRQEQAEFEAGLAADEQQAGDAADTPASGLALPQPDQGGHAAGAPVTAVGKIP